VSIDSDSQLCRQKTLNKLLNSKHERGFALSRPSDDGGYYLIGMNKPHRHLFEKSIGAPNVCSTKRCSAQPRSEIEVKTSTGTGMMFDDDASCAVVANELLTDTTSARYRAAHSEFLRAS